MDFIDKLRNLINSAKEYINLKVQDIKLDVADKMASAIADIVASLSFAFFLVVFVLFASIGASLLLNRYLESGYAGFFVVAFFWLLTGGVIFLTRNSLIKRPVKNWFVEKALSEGKTEE